MPQNPHKFGSSEYDEWNYRHPDVAPLDPVADAKVGLAQADRFSHDIIDAQPSVMPNQFLGGDTGAQNGFANEQGSVFDSPMDKLARLGRQVVRPIPNAIKGAAGVGSFIPGPVGMGSRAVLGGVSAADLASGGLEGLTEHPVRSALDAAGVAAGLSSLKGLRAFANAGGADVESLANLLGGQALAHEAQSQPMRPWLQASGAAAPSAVDELMASPSFSKLPQGAVSKAKQSPFKRMSAEGAFGGDRTTGQFTEGPSGLSAVAKGRVKPNDMPWETLPIPSSKPLDPMERLAARSKERFGKQYRKE